MSCRLRAASKLQLIELTRFAGAETQGGQRLLPRVEFRTYSEASASLSFARASAGDVKQNGILLRKFQRSSGVRTSTLMWNLDTVNLDGSMTTIQPVKDAVYKRLQLLERQLLRHTQHFAALNPRAFRCVCVCISLTTNSLAGCSGLMPNRLQSRSQ